ncbi:conserved hypothetical protein [Luminiphilus syltensis NOR5-1B]|uniref:ABC-type transport auxiliary lipoprotein component domain-containing protein n=1 Tax=Luminiphilus syltensis NOR5-1B TaxID=565045 RepID=B8KVI0_9GAMM|nr:PqiC family protein [Luminiphilus syltensis]EED36185.1 conserved hypothetical protein [Luminiphilus syltensis NOR5-1B]
MRTFGRIRVGLLAIALLSGCATQTLSEFHRLEARGASTVDRSGPSIGLRPVQVPGYLRRLGVVWLEDDGSTTVSSQHRWAEPLDVGIQRITELNLASLLGAKSVQRYPWNPASGPDVVINVVIIDMTAGGQGARLVADIGVGRSHKALANRLVDLEEPLPVSPSGESVANAYSALLFTLAKEIARDISELGRDASELPPST